MIFLLQYIAASIPIVFKSFQELIRILYIGRFGLEFKKLEHRVLSLYMKRNDLGTDWVVHMPIPYIDEKITSMLCRSCSMIR